MTTPRKPKVVKKLLGGVSKAKHTVWEGSNQKNLFRGEVWIFSKTQVIHFSLSDWYRVIKGTYKNKSINLTSVNYRLATPINFRYKHVPNIHENNEQRLENNVNSLKNNENIFKLLKNHWMPSRIFLKTFQDKINKVRMPPGFLTRYACVF